MSSQANATKSDINDVLNVLQDFISMSDNRIVMVETEQQKVRYEIRQIMGYLDAMAKRQEISDDERLVMGHQLDRLNR